MSDDWCYIQDWLLKVRGTIGCPSFLFITDVESLIVDSFGTTHLVGLGCCILVAGQLDFAGHACVI
jgi:hypothetical protein